MRRLQLTPKKQQRKSHSSLEYPRVTVRWSDCITLDSWLRLEDAKLLTPLECVTTGYLLQELEDYVTVVQTLGNDKKCFATAVIPRPMILEILRCE